MVFLLLLEPVQDTEKTDTVTMQKTVSVYLHDPLFDDYLGSQGPLNQRRAGVHGSVFFRYQLPVPKVVPA